jgi:hypothetical protein
MRLWFYQPAGDHDRKYLLNPIFPRRQFKATPAGECISAFLFFINSTSASLAIEKAANLHAVLKDGVIQHIVQPLEKSSS